MFEIVLILAVIFMVSAAGYAVFGEPFHLQTTHHTLQLPHIQRKLRIVQFSDVHLKSIPSLFQLTQAVAAINVCQPDVVIFSGDLLDSRHILHHTGKAARILSGIQAPVKLAVSGNHDWLKEDLQVYTDLIQKSGFVLMDNKVQEICVNGSPLVFTGLPSLEKDTELEDIMSCLPRKEGCQILLAHQPASAMEQTRPFDLALTAHNHGGQINIFWLPGFKNLSLGKSHNLQWLRGFYATPYIKNVYVNAGVGTTHIPARIFAQPEIAVFDLYPAKAAS